jgi:hypothetical protein
MAYKMNCLAPSAVFASLMLLSACSTPLEDCVSNAQRNYNATYQAIQVAEGNVARGYAINSQQVPYQYTGSCYNSYIGSYACQQTGYRTDNTPVAIDVNEERRKIRKYSAALPNIKKQTEAAVEQCRRTYPAK